jgi:general secretion pathway protein E
VEVSIQTEIEKYIPFLTQGTVDWEHDPLSSVLINQGKIKLSELNQLQEVSHSRSDALGVALVRYGILSEIDLATTLSEITNLPVMEASAYSAIESAPGILPLRFLKNLQAIPVEWDDKSMILAMAEPRDLDTIQSISATVNLKIEPRIGLCSHIQNCIDRLISLDQQPVEEINAGTDEDMFPGDETFDDVSHLRELASEAPTIQAVNRILQEAIRIKASDIHFEPGSEGLRVRYRVDGTLRFGETLPLNSAAAINSRIKIMARLDIAEHRLPQDGRIQLKISGKEINIRVSTVPILYGESVVIRVLDKSRVAYDYDYLGFDAKTLASFKDILSRPTGIFLVTGPTGCGKTTTLYTGLNQVNSIERKIITVEDPVEYQFDGVNQIAVQPKIGLSFASILKTILRQDPDVILIGEMRDTETAHIAVQAALTGHLVLSTLHTIDAVTGITRLLDMGVEDFLVTSTVNAVFAQRLIRKLCAHCKMSANDETNEYVAVGCEHCGHTGYEGRTVIYEMFVISDQIRNLILKQPGATAIRAQAMKLGMTSMYDCGMRLVAQGITSRSEILRVSSVT